LLDFRILETSYLVMLIKEKFHYRIYGYLELMTEFGISIISGVDFIQIFFEKFGFNIYNFDYNTII